MDVVFCNPDVVLGGGPGDAAPFRPECLVHLASLLLATHARLVITSPRRRLAGYAPNVAKALLSVGARPVLDEVPQMPPVPGRGVAEVCAWLASAGGTDTVRQWVVLDSPSVVAGPQGLARDSVAAHLVPCEAEAGITAAAVQAALALLQFEGPIPGLALP
eukprot:EG_transcript_37624